MSERFQRRQMLCAPGDCVDTVQQWLGMLALAGVIVRPDAPELPEKLRRDYLRNGSDKPTPRKNEQNTAKPKEYTLNVPGSRIKKARLMRKMGLRTLSRLSGIDRNTLRGYESLRITPTLWSLCRVARILDVSIDYLACIERQAGSVRCLCA